MPPWGGGDYWLRRPYTPIEDIFVPLPLHRQSDIRSIARRNIRLRHQESRPNLALQQGIEPFPLLCIVAVLCQHLHVPSVRRSAIGSLNIDIHHFDLFDIMYCSP